MDGHRTEADVGVDQVSDIGSSGVENGIDRDAILAADDVEANKENAGPSIARPTSEQIHNHHRLQLSFLNSGTMKPSQIQQRRPPSLIYKG
jgi:hypothetical protein